MASEVVGGLFPPCGRSDLSSMSRSAGDILQVNIARWETTYQAGASHVRTNVSPDVPWSDGAQSDLWERVVVGAVGLQGGEAADGKRRCVGCGTILAADNNARLCSRCGREQRDQLNTPPVLPDIFFDTDEFRTAFESRNIGKVFKAYRNHPRHLKMYGKALNQGLLARWLKLNQGQVSKLENGQKTEDHIGTLVEYAQILHLPQRHLWFLLPGHSRLIVPGAARYEAADLENTLITATDMNTVELLQRVRASAVDSATLDALSIVVEQLCCDYPHADARDLITTAKGWLEKVTSLLDNRLTLSQHRDLLNHAGMLALLVGCLEYDLGESAPAEATRRMALSLGQESGVPGIVGWSHEMLAWFHLTTGNLRAVIPAAEAGILAAPSHSVAVQLFGQKAKAFARMGMREEVHEAMESGRALLENLPYPARPDNHFVVDPDKWDFYAMDTYRIVGEDDLAERNAEEVIRRSTSPNGAVVAPMRKAEAELTLAVIAARRGAMDEASTLGTQALRDGRQSRPSLLMVASELDQEMRKHGPGVATDFRDLLADIKQGPTPSA